MLILLEHFPFYLFIYKPHHEKSGFLLMRKQRRIFAYAKTKADFCLCENKGADQLCSISTADQRLCFRYSDSTIPSAIYIQNFNHLAFFCAYTARVVSDLITNHVVFSSTARSYCSHPGRPRSRSRSRARSRARARHTCVKVF